MMVLYSCETWAMTKKDRFLIQACELRFLRSVLDYKRVDSMRNSIRQSLKVYSSNTITEEFCNTWKMHVDRMGADSKASLLLQTGSDKTTRETPEDVG